MKYTEVLRNEHFNNLAAIIRVPFLSHAWKSQHAGTPFWLLLNGFTDTLTSGVPLNKKQVVVKFTEFITALTQADERLSYTEDDLTWFLSVVDMPDGEAKAILNLFTAWFSANDSMVTPVEIAEQTGTAASGWRNKAANGEFPGAIKRGDTWLIPVSILRSHGVNVEAVSDENDN